MRENVPSRRQGEKSWTPEEKFLPLLVPLHNRCHHFLKDLMTFLISLPLLLLPCPYFPFLSFYRNCNYFFIFQICLFRYHHRTGYLCALAANQFQLKQLLLLFLQFFFSRNFCDIIEFPHRCRNIQYNSLPIVTIVPGTIYQRCFFQ